MVRRARLARVSRLAVALLLIGLIGFPATGAPNDRRVDAGALTHVSQSAAIRYWLARPAQAPEPLQDRFRNANAAVAQATQGASAAAESLAVLGDVFNGDELGFPQNEESVSVCRLDDSQVLSGTNDYRGLLDPEGNFTGWHFSADGGATLAKEGLLPPVTEGGTDTRPSGGDPVDVVSEVDCDLFASSLNYDPFDPFANTNGIGIYKTDVATLLSPECGDDGPSDPDCWPTRRFAAFSSDPTHFFDKEWFDVGETGDGEHVWVTYSDFDFTPTPPNPAGFTAEIFAVRCDADLVACTDPIPISEDDVDVQFSDVTIGPDGRTYVTWSQIFGELEGTAQTFVHKMRVAEPGSTTFGPERVIFSEELAIPFGGFLHANDFRVATYPKNEVSDLGGPNPRVYVLWDACQFRPLDSICEEPIIWITYSDDFGASWSPRIPISAGGDNYFASIAADPVSGRLVAVWFTNRFDRRFHNQYDVELVRLNDDGTVKSRKRVTRPSNESEADPLLGGFFIGDYIEVFAHDRTAYVAYNANYRQVQLLFEGVPVNQQDNYLTTVRA